MRLTALACALAAAASAVVPAHEIVYGSWCGGALDTWNSASHGETVEHCLERCVAFRPATRCARITNGGCWCQDAAGPLCWAASIETYDTVSAVVAGRAPTVECGTNLYAPPPPRRRLTTLAGNNLIVFAIIVVVVLAAGALAAKKALEAGACASSCCDPSSPPPSFVAMDHTKKMAIAQKAVPLKSGRLYASAAASAVALPTGGLSPTKARRHHALQEAQLPLEIGIGRSEDRDGVWYVFLSLLLS
jgi:hypothetical protein